ncbi:hypothetical protein PLEOSDRAFT_162777 [Pleurotus ostreatus PC15]|uniref:Uncharacterized protein n=1 Tax=Pleurotus ostreatus (strain PC15) TaxID=1137138 RepID=A0A067NHD8_PLEO1|nr:hypothetical protein PLEOSDRAFT_162777 [Pleurotus ostreatus PC15]
MIDERTISVILYGQSDFNMVKLFTLLEGIKSRRFSVRSAAYAQQVQWHMRLGVSEVYGTKAGMPSLMTQIYRFWLSSRPSSSLLRSVLSGSVSIGGLNEGLKKALAIDLSV